MAAATKTTPTYTTSTTFFSRFVLRFKSFFSRKPDKVEETTPAYFDSEEYDRKQVRKQARKHIESVKYQALRNW